MAINIDDVRINRIVDYLLENKMVVFFSFLDNDGDVFGEEQEAVFWKDQPVDVLDGVETVHQEDNWFTLPENYSEAMIKRAQEARVALKVMLE